MQVTNERESRWPWWIISWPVANLVIFLENNENQSYKISIKGVFSLVKRHVSDFQPVETQTRAAGFDQQWAEKKSHNFAQFGTGEEISTDWIMLAATTASDMQVSTGV